MYISSAKLKYFTLQKAIFGTEGINPIYYYLHAHIPKAMNQSWQLLTACSFNTRHTYKSCTVFLYLSALYF